jgi:hypothetical protein
MTHSNNRTLINRGRKAGLNTGELYSALATRPSEGADQVPGVLDGNGFITSYDQHGRLVIRPVVQSKRS